MPYEHERELAEWRGEIEARVAAMEREIDLVRKRHHDTMNQVLQPLVADITHLRRTLDDEPPWMADLAKKLDHLPTISRRQDEHVTLKQAGIWVSIASTAGAAGWFLAQLAK